MGIATLFFTTLAVSAAGGLVPLINVELWLVGVAATCPSAALWPVVLAASLGQVAAKAVLYCGGEAAFPCLRGRGRKALAAVQGIQAQGSVGTAVVFGSALTGLPPLYVISVAAGAVRFPLRRFLALTLTGRVLRFAVVFSLPGALHALGAGR